MLPSEKRQRFAPKGAVMRPHCLRPGRAIDLPAFEWAVSSAVEHCFHTAGATGSIPVPPTRNQRLTSGSPPPSSSGQWVPRNQTAAGHPRRSFRARTISAPHGLRAHPPRGHAIGLRDPGSKHSIATHTRASPRSQKKNGQCRGLASARQPSATRRSRSSLRAARRSAFGARPGRPQRDSFDREPRATAARSPT
jgi:hypothetical protein